MQVYPVTSNNLNYAGVAVGVMLVFSFGWCVLPFAKVAAPKPLFAALRLLSSHPFATLTSERHPWCREALCKHLAHICTACNMCTCNMCTLSVLTCIHGLVLRFGAILRRRWYSPIKGAGHWFTGPLKTLDASVSGKTVSEAEPDV